MPNPMPRIGLQALGPVPPHPGRERTWTSRTPDAHPDRRATGARGQATPTSVAARERGRLDGVPSPSLWHRETDTDRTAALLVRVRAEERRRRGPIVDVEPLVDRLEMLTDCRTRHA